MSCAVVYGVEKVVPKTTNGFASLVSSLQYVGDELPAIPKISLRPMLDLIGQLTETIAELGRLHS